MKSAVRSETWCGALCIWEKRIKEILDEHPCIDKYDRIAHVDWESCSVMLDAHTQLDALMRSWDGRRM